MSEKPAHAYRSHAMQDDYCEQLLPHDSSKGTEWIACGLPRSAHPASPPEPKPESEKCFVCGAQPVVMATGLCGPCTFGEAEMIGQSE